METECIPYKDTGYFSKTIIDYLDNSSLLREFYQYEPELSSFKKAIKNRNFSNSQRNILSSSLEKQLC